MDFLNPDDCNSGWNFLLTQNGSNVYSNKLIRKSRPRRWSHVKKRHMRPPSGSKNKKFIRTLVIPEFVSIRITLTLPSQTNFYA